MRFTVMVVQHAEVGDLPFSTSSIPRPTPRQGLDPYGRFVDRLGGTCLSRSIRGEWPVQTVAHINVLELCTVLKMLLHFSNLVRSSHMLIRTAWTAAYVNRQAGVRSSALHQAAVELWLWAH